MNADQNGFSEQTNMNIPASDPETGTDSGVEVVQETGSAPVATVPFRRKLISGAFDYLELFTWAVFAVLLIFTFGVRLCRVDGQSMENTLNDGQMLVITSTFYTPKQDDIIVFHLTNADAGMEKTLVKRVIATGGQEVVIDTFNRTITVDGVPYDDPHSVLKDGSDRIVEYYYSGLFHYGYDRQTGIFRVTVPENTVFVMGDNRNNSKDSRNPDVGFVDERCILGKAIVRLSPFTIFS